ncbi:hypothetical protein G6F36_014077 [Rhizopus arrhizus]|nr:hypothetical protein G6F36_014077 [Rhizopus arrhizus]
MALTTSLAFHAITRAGRKVAPNPDTSLEISNACAVLSWFAVGYLDRRVTYEHAGESMRRSEQDKPTVAFIINTMYAEKVSFDYRSASSRRFVGHQVLRGQSWIANC